MKKIIKNISRFLFSLLLIVSIFGTFNVLAETVIFQITKIEVKEKSDKVTVNDVVNDVSLSGGSIVNDIVFTEKDDYIIYNITIKNNTEDDYTIKSITDDNTSPYLKYTYDNLSNVKVESGKEKTFNMTITYIQETSNLTITDQAVSLTLTYEKVDGTTGSETITNPDNNASTGEVKGATENITNPKTGDNITTYIILGIISLMGLAITTVSKKHLSKSLMAITVISMVAIPLGVRANSDKYIITFSSNRINNSYSQVVTGLEFNLAVSKLASGNNELELWCDPDDSEVCYIVNGAYTEDDDEYWDYKNDFEISILSASKDKFNSVKDDLTDINKVSLSDSALPLYIWKEDNIIYIYSSAKKIILNSDCSNMFLDLGLNSIDLSMFDTSNVTNMSSMFSFNNLESIDLSNFDTSNVTNMSSMFSVNDKLKNINISNFDTSKVTDMSYMFGLCNSLTELDLSNFNTENVTNMGHMFYDSRNLKSLDISSFDTSKVKYMNSMFGASYNIYDIPQYSLIETIYVSDKFVTDSVEDDSNMFFLTVNLVGENNTHFSDDHSNGEYARIDDPDNGKPGYFTLKQN